MGLLDDMKLRNTAKENLLKDLDSAKNLQDFFDICGKHFDCKGTELSSISKAALKGNIDKLLFATGAKPLKK